MSSALKAKTTADGDKGIRGESLKREFATLVKYASDDDTKKGAVEFRRYLDTQTRDLRPEILPKYFSELIQYISGFIKGTVTERLAALIATQCLLRSEVEGNLGDKVVNLGKNMRECLAYPDLRVMQMAVSCLSTLSLREGTLVADFVEGEIKRSFLALERNRSETTYGKDSKTSQVDSVSIRRHSAVMCLEVLAKNCPTLFFVHVGTFFEIIWTGLIDKQLAVRDSSADALRAVLTMIVTRKNQNVNEWYKHLYERAKKGLDASPSSALESVHGSLVAVRELTRRPSECIRNKFEEISGLVLKLMRVKIKDDKAGVIQATVISTLPLLAALSPDDFGESHREEYMRLLLDATREDACRGVAFTSLGQLSKAMESVLISDLEKILKAIKVAFPKVRNKPTEVDHVMVCIKLLCEAGGSKMSETSLINEILGVMFHFGLREEMTSALTAMATHVPSMFPDIQERLLNLISMVLTKKTYDAAMADNTSQNQIHVDSTPSVLKPFSASSKQKSSIRKSSSSGSFTAGQVPITAQSNSESIPLALRVLGTFDFTTRSIEKFARKFLLSLLDQEVFEIRKEAAITCAQVAIRPWEEPTKKGDKGQIVSDIISKLLIVGISDRDPDIRRTVLSSLSKKYDIFLAESENLKCLFMGLNDEVFEIRSLSIGIIGRLATQNPAFVMPSLRKTLVQLLTELEFSGVARNKEESARLLTCLIQSSGPVTKPHAKTILDALLPKVHDPSPRVASAVLSALGELSQIARVEMQGCVNDLFPLILATLKDQSSVFARETALRALGLLVSNLGNVIDPYIRYPDLLPLLLYQIKTETNPVNREHVLRVFGLLGALDPYRHRLSQLEEGPKDGRIDTSSINPSDYFQKEGGGEDEVYSMGAVLSLTKILEDPSLSKHHITVISVLMSICRSLKSRCSIFLPVIMPLFFKILRSKEHGIHDLLFQQVSVLVELAKDDIRIYLDDIFGLVHAFWDTNMITQILGLVEKMVKILEAEIKVYLPGLVPLLLRLLHTGKSNWRLKVLSTLDTLGGLLSDYLHLVIPALVKAIEMYDFVMLSATEKSFSIIHLQTLGKLCGKLDIADYASRITNPLLRVLECCGEAEIQQNVLDVICVLVYQLGGDYAVFVPIIDGVLLKGKIVHLPFRNLVGALLKHESMEEVVSRSNAFPLIKCEVSSVFKRAESEKNLLQNSQKSKLYINVENLKKAWKATQDLTKDDWHEWMRRFSVALIKESPSTALHECLHMAQMYHPLARNLFNYGFYSCWRELDKGARMDCVVNLQRALEAPEIPPEILHTLLNLAEFLEHNQDPLPMPITHKLLGDLAEKNHAYAKALHYKEIEFQHYPTSCIEALISVNNQLGLPEAAGGILTYAQQQQGMDLKESWYEKLLRWEEALAAYEAKQEEDPDNCEITLGRLRCYQALGDWQNVTQLSHSVWKQASPKFRTQIAPIAAAAFLHLQKYDLMSDYIEKIEEEGIQGSFYRAVVACHQGQFMDSKKLINKARKYLDIELTALVSESYERAYPMLCIVQQLSELEEVIEYKENEDRRESIREMWKKRILGVERSVDVWRSLLSVRSLALSREEDVDVYLKYSSLLQSQGRYRASHAIILSLTESRKSSTIRVNKIDPRVAYHYIKYLWAAGSKSAALQGARSYVKGGGADEEEQGKMYHNIAQWKMQMEGERDEGSLTDILLACKSCIEHADNWYKGWHLWAVMNFEAVSFHEKHSDSSKARKKIAKHLVAAVQGFFRSIALSPRNSLQDTLRLLTLMFKHGGDKSAEAALVIGFATVSVDTWLQVIPQVIARIHSPSKSVRNLVRELLTTVGTHHPQALVYPLTVASTSSSDPSNIANIVLKQMKENSDSEKLVEQAKLVSSELIRVSINWFESWSVGFETASRQFFKENDPEGMVQTLVPLHEQLEAGPETQNEVSFVHLYGRRLREAYESLELYTKKGELIHLHRAWDHYRFIFMAINRLPFMAKINLEHVSPKLLAAEDLDLAVPGTYQANQEIVRIKKFSPILSVLTSKQRPRKMTVVGDNGRDYPFLLKGHEDLRQDERVMQLFGLVNTLLAEGEYTSKLHLQITRYEAIPLSPNSGLIEWVPGCNTLLDLIKKRREDTEVELKYEQMQEEKFAPKGQYDFLTGMQKVEVYQYAIASTPGDEFAKILWLWSPNSETWLSRRTHFTRSLALMSMVGYILGLGDRHLSNIMFERNTGKVLHIDFGDCFEVLRHRDKYPEKIPFRLTRMLIHAMEVSGIEGNFRSTCEWVMRLLRDNKESLMAVLEAFVYDPLVNWRLEGGGGGEENKDEIEEEEGGGESRESIHRTSSSLAKRVQPKGKEEAVAREGGVGGDDPQQAEMLNERAVEVIARVNNKLTGQDFSNEVLDVEAQVHKLVAEATSHENLSQLFKGWGPFW